MGYINPRSGLLEEQHPIGQRKGFMWAKYFAMDEDHAEAADDKGPPYEMWQWPLTGDISCQGMYETEREETYWTRREKYEEIRWPVKGWIQTEIT
ncbi:UNVERIFIED_CONTAM: hypothetical protein Slati_4197100 [Sesamum latifolium]|uniref:Uncharacterized protein n=1 Tax=Sesamum latifolium TaxID=2727402 RepID=A0AAW2TAP1_9LAMI